MTTNTDYPDEQLEDDRLKDYKVTARVEIETSEVLLAGRAEDAAHFHQQTAETIADEQRGGER